MNQFSKATLEAVRLMKEESIKDPRKAWDIAIRKFTNKETSIKKGCPKNTFLGIYSANLIKELPANDFKCESKEKEYAIKAIQMLKTDKSYKKNKRSFWGLISDTAYQSQLDVVIVLDDYKLLN